VTIAIYQLNKYSAAHFNPAVTIAFTVLKLFPAKEVFPYIFSQIAGAFAGSILLKLMFQNNDYLGTTLPSGSVAQSFWLEIILTLILMLVILFVSQSKGLINKLAGLLIGLTVMFEAYFAGPICGASMNPARSIAPALVSGHTEHLWLYISAPIIGAITAVAIWKILKPLKNL